jgi:peroxiredoxin
MVFRYIRQIFGAKPMSCVGHGKPAPSFTLPGMKGESFSLAAALKKGPVFFAFFKISCPVCQFTFPFLQRLFEMYGGEKVTIWAISQDDSEDTRDFCKEYGVKFPALIDADNYSVSNQYGITNVPSMFLVAPDGKLTASSLGFDKKILEKVSKELARDAGKPEQTLFRPGEIIPDYKPG